MVTHMIRMWSRLRGRLASTVPQAPRTFQSHPEVSPIGNRWRPVIQFQRATQGSPVFLCLFCFALRKNTIHPVWEINDSGRSTSLPPGRSSGQRKSYISKLCHVGTMIHLRSSRNPSQSHGKTICPSPHFLILFCSSNPKSIMIG